MILEVFRMVSEVFGIVLGICGRYQKVLEDC
jgi:hypothetical protein